MDKNKIVIGILVIFVLMTLVSCAPAGYSSKEYGFFAGIIHGIVFPFALIGKLFGSDIGLYADHNTGFTYWLGFILGIGGLGGFGRGAYRR